ncbi:transport and Golgi organization protein 1 isoform X2 [Pseudomyrmex gracilis]|uniref:transport and Golgi organization protein 1 isoform X2 n=1 Tax=Pseudomyrmex gracilis TaxID=219809 RepID=UPI0009959D56|nr:transport and Golgi organization protein 1 isoform X2 [Pseudomyrmex gracilis]
MMKIIRIAHVFSLLAIILCTITQCLAALSDKQLCYDPDCSKPISMARTILSYRPIDPELMAFGLNVDVKVFSKGAGKRTDLWGVEISGKRGFVPKTFLKEYKVLQHKLSYEVPVYKFTGEVNKVQTTTLDSIEKPHPPLKDEALNNKETSSIKSVDENGDQESKAINPDSTLSPYEVIDGTTVYMDVPSVSSSSVSDVAQPNRLANEQDAVLESVTDTKTDTSHNEPLSNKNSFVNDKEFQADAEDASIEVIKTTNTAEEDSSEVHLESSEAIEDAILSTESKDDILTLNGNSKSVEDEPSEIAEQEEKSDNNAEESIAEDKKEEVTEDSAKNEGIFASLTNTFKMLSSSDTTAEDTQSSDSSLPATEVTTENNSPKEVAKDKSEDVTDTIPTVQEVDTNLDSDFTNKEKVEIEQEVKHENVDKEASSVPSETTESSSNVPSDNFLHVDADKHSNEPALISNDTSTFAKTDNSHVNIQVQEVNEKQITGSIVEESIVSDTRETVTEESGTDQKSNDIDQKLPQNIDKVPEINKFSSLEETTESNKIESLPESHTVEENTEIADETLSHSAANSQPNENVIVHTNVNKNDNLITESISDNVPKQPNEFSDGTKFSSVERSVDSSHESVISEKTTTFNQDPQNQNLFNIEGDSERTDIESQIVSSVKNEETLLHDDHREEKVAYKDEDDAERLESKSVSVDQDEACLLDDKCTTESIATELPEQHVEESKVEEDDFGVNVTNLDYNYWKTLIYLCVTAFTTLVFTLGYYYIENTRRDGQLIARINELEKKLLVSTKECEVLSENLKTTEKKLNWLTDDSLGSNEMVASLKAELEASQIMRTELEEQVAMLEKDLENATEAGLELEKMLSAVISSNNEVSPLAKSIEDLQARLDAQQTANESLSNALNLKAQEIESLSTELASFKRKCNALEIKLSETQNKLATQSELMNNIEETLTDKIHDLEEQVNGLSIEKSSLYKELKAKEIEMKELTEMISQIKSNNLDLEKLYDVSRVKTEAALLRDERDELKMRLNDVEGAHQLLEEHMQLVKEEIVALSDQCKMAENQCKIAEKDKKDAETRLEVLTKFFQEKENERQKEEAIWLEKQGEVVSTVERIHTMQNEIQGYKQQIEMLKREIVDQEREYKNQISALDKKAHEQWIAARQNERRLVESKAEAGQLRNRLTLVEKNLNDSDAEAKLHRRKRFSKVRQFWNTMEGNNPK